MNLKKNLWVYALILMTVMTVDASLTLEPGTLIQPGDGNSSYILNNTLSLDALMVNSSHAIFEGMGVNMDVWNMTSGGIHQDVDNLTLPATNSDEHLYFSDFIHNLTGIILENMTGTITNLTVCYTNYAPGNLSIIMEDLSGDCNYGLYYTNGTNVMDTPGTNILSLFSNRTNAVQTYCNNTIWDNSTSGTHCYRLQKEEGLSIPNIPAGVWAAVGAGIGLLIYYKKYS